MNTDTDFVAYLARRAASLSEDEALLRLRRDLKTIGARLVADSPKVHSRSLIAAAGIVEDEMRCRPHLSESRKAEASDSGTASLISWVLSTLNPEERERALLKVVVQQSRELEQARASLRAAMHREERSARPAAIDAHGCAVLGSFEGKGDADAHR